MLLRILIFLVLTPVLAQASSRDARERQEVVKIFDLLIPKMDVKSGDGIGSDIDCVFSRTWGLRWSGPTESEATRPPHELLSIQQALDPKGEHSDMFCDRDERDKQAKILAQSNGKSIPVANFDFTYPIFGRNLQSATVRYYRESISFAPGHNYPPASSHGVISLRKQKGVWTFKVSVEGMS